MRACTCGHHRAFKSKRDLTGSTTERADEIYREKGEEEGEKDSHLRAGPGSTRVRSRERQEKEREKKRRAKGKNRIRVRATHREAMACIRSAYLAR